MSQASCFSNTCWKKTALGTPIELFAQSSLEHLHRPIILIGGVHGDEPEGVRLAQDTLRFLLSADQKQLVPWILIPCLNIDGFAQKQRTNGRKVDLNRNYPATNWSPKAVKERYFPGPSAGSEPEVMAMVELIQTHKPRLVIHCHSWEPCIVCTGAPGIADGERLARNSGYKLTEDIGYPTPGSLSQYGWLDNRVPVICIEEQEGLEDLGAIWPRFQKAMLEIFTDKSERQ